jgi:hypothetical protein
MFEVVILGALCVVGAIVRYVFVWRSSLPAARRPSVGWNVALALLLIVDLLLMLAFLFAIAVYNCHGASDCPI